jgi:hypothetical protein
MKDQDLNKLLDSYTVRPPSAGLAARIVAQAANTPQGAVVVPFPRRSGQNAGLGNVWRPAAALIAASFVGFWIGFSGMVGVLPDEQDVSLYAMGFEGDAYAAVEGDGL